MSVKETTSCFVCGFLLCVGRVCKGYDKLLSGKTFPSKESLWVSGKIPKWVKPYPVHSPTHPPAQMRKKTQRLSEKGHLTQYLHGIYSFSKYVLSITMY